MIDRRELIMAKIIEERTSDPVIDEGFRRWYEACPCCLSEAHPGIKQELDREREETPGRSDVGTNS